MPTPCRMRLCVGELYTCRAHMYCVPTLMIHFLSSLFRFVFYHLRARFRAASNARLMWRRPKGNVPAGFVLLLGLCRLGELRPLETHVRVSLSRQPSLCSLRLARL